MKEMLAEIKKTLRHGMKNQSGQSILVMVLVLLVVGALMMGPLLGFMSTGLKSGQMHESKLQELYAADSGVEDGIRWIIGGKQIDEGPWTWNPEGFWERESYEINDRSVNVTAKQVDTQTYNITSIASADGGSTTIESYVSPVIMNFSDFLDNAITSNMTVTIQPGTNVTGDIQLPDEENLDNKGNITGEIKTDPINWPTDEQLSAFYWEDVEGLGPFPHNYIDIDGTATSIDSLYRDGSLDVYNGVNIAANATLNGTVYVGDDPTVDLEIGKEKHDFTLDLNGQTIYCEGGIWVGDRCTIAGSGCIIAVGDIYFAPKGDVGSENDFVFIMSVTGETQLNPQGDFYGSVAGNVHVDLQPGNTFTWVEPSDGLNFPDGTGNKGWTDMSILSWEID